MISFLSLMGIITTIMTIFGINNILSSEPTSIAPYVYYLNFKPESDKVLQELAKLYMEETGIEVTVFSPPSGTYGETLKKEITGSKPPTLFVEGGFQYLSEYANNIYVLQRQKLQMN